MMKKKIFISVISVLTLALFVSCASAKTKEEVISGDARLVSGDWIALAKMYPIPDAAGDVVMKEPAPELLGEWWKSMGDDTLTNLIDTALRNNRDLLTARSKVVQARAALGINKAAILPWLDSTDYWQRARNSEATYPAAGGSPNNVFHLGIDASWEIDVFGGKRQTIKAGAAAMEAQYASLYSTWVSLSAEIASDYISLRTLQERLAVAEDNLRLQQETYDMLASRVKAGLSDQLALSQSKYTLEQTKASIPPIKTSIESTKNALAILVGEIPGGLEEALKDKKPIPQANGSVLMGIPANMLRQRPDIRAAERNLAAQLARRKSAQADLWPKFYLSGSIGTESLTTGSLFEGPNKLYSFGPQITLPIFHWGAIKNNIKVQTELQRQALDTYESTVLNAVGEVRNAITASLQERLRNASLKDGLAAAKVALLVANDKYKTGLTNFDTVINAQKAVLTLSETYAISNGQITTDAVQLFKALGGGWTPLDAEAAAQAEAAKKKK